MEQVPILKTTERENGSIRIRWENSLDSSSSYPLTLLGEPESPLDLPGRLFWMNKKEISNRQDIVVLGERSCGIQDFLTWCSEELNGFPRLTLHGSRWLPSLAEAQGIESEKEKDKALAALAKMASEETADGKANALIEWANPLQVHFFIMIHDLPSLGSKASSDLAMAFRLIRDAKVCKKLHILMGSSSESYLTDGIFSSFLPMTYRYRMRPFDESCIRLLLRNAFGESVRIGDEVVAKIVDVVGGQPFLTNRLLHRMQNETATSGTVDLRSVETAFRLEKRTPHPVVQSWKKDLSAILGEDPVLLKRMRAYVADKTFGLEGYRPEDRERPLFVAGWLRELRDKRWGISSELHAALARPVLDQFPEDGEE